MNRLSPASKLRWNIGWQEMGIASCYIRIGIFDMAETVQYIDKFIHQLYLINNDIVKFLVLDSVVNIVKHHIRIP